MSPGISPLLDSGWAKGRGPIAFDYQLSYSASFSGTGTSSWQFGQQTSPSSSTSSSMMKFLPQPGHSSLNKASMIFLLDEIESRRRLFWGSDRDFFALGSPEDFPESPFHPDFCIRRFGAIQRHTKQDFAA